MPLIQNNSIDALPYIDAAPSAEALSSALALIQAELDAEHGTALHPSIPALRESKLPSSIQAEHEKLASKAERTPAIDLSRYEALDAPNAGQTDQWKIALQHAYASAEYLKSRETNLALLETYGKNAWLVGNSQLEDILRDLERDVEQAKQDLESVENARRSTQENAAGEMQSLDQAWRTGVGRMIETQAAAEALRQEILQRKRLAAAT